MTRALRTLLLAAALVCVSAARPADRLFAATPPRDGGGLIAFEAGGAIYIGDAGGGSPTQIVSHKDGVNMQPALSPDGARVAFSSKRDGKFSIYVVGVDGEGLRRLTDGPGDDSEPAWSPDGSRVIFVGGDKGEDVHLYLIASDGIGAWVQLTSVTSDRAQKSFPSWAGAVVR